MAPGSLMAARLRQSRGFTLGLLWGLGDYVGSPVPAPQGSVGRWLGQRVGPRQHPQRRGLCEVLPACDDRYSRGGVETARGPREEINEGAEASLGPGANSEGYKGHLRAHRSVWWKY